MTEFVRCNIVTVSFILLAIVYLLCFSGLLSTDAMWINDEGNRVLTLQAYALDSSSILPDKLAVFNVPYDGLDSYPPPYFVRSDDGAFRSGYSPLLPWLGSFVYDSSGLAGARLIPFVSGLLCALLCALICGEVGLPKTVQSFGVMLAGLCTPLMFYSLLFLEITVAAMLFSCGILFALKLLSDDSVQHTPTRWMLYAVLSGFACGATVLFREEGYIACTAVFLGLLLCRINWRKIVFFSVSSALVVIPLLVFNWLVSGTVFGLHHKIYESICGTGGACGMLYSFYFFVFKGCGTHHLWAAIPFIMLFWAGFLYNGKQQISGRIMNVLMCLTAAAAVWNVLCELISPEPLENVLYFQSLCGNVAFVAVVFAFSRILLTDEKKSVRFAAAVLLFCIAGIGISLRSSVAGVFFGARHFVVIMPLACALVLYVMQSAYVSRVFRICGIILVICAFASQMQGIGLLRMKKDFSLALIEEVSTAENAIVATDVFWIPEELAVLDRSKKILLIKDDSALKNLEDICRLNGMSSYTMILSPHFRKLSDAALRKACSSADVVPGKKMIPDGMDLLTLQFFTFNIKDEPESGK